MDPTPPPTDETTHIPTLVPTTDPTTNATSDDDASTPTNPLSPHQQQNDEDTATTTTTDIIPKKQRRKRKHYPGIISMTLRPHSARTPTLHSLTSSSFSLPRRRRRLSLSTPSSLPPSPSDVAALISLSVGFPLDTLTEDELDHLGGWTHHGTHHQGAYISARNHLLSRWRSDVFSHISLETALHSLSSVLPPDLHFLIPKAHSFLQQHGFINFGLCPSLKDVNFDGLDSSLSTSCTVLIIGAGLAGLCAARQLKGMGFKVILLEGRARPGGRVKTKKMWGKVSGGGSEGEESVIVGAADLGGSVLTGINGNPLGVLARQLGFPLHKVRDICPLYLPDGKAVNKEVDSRVETVFNKLLDRVCKLRQVMMEEMKCVDVSLGTGLEAFRKVFNVGDSDKVENMLLNWHLANLEYANASLLSDLSMAFWDQDDPYEMGGDHCFIPGGNERFIRALAEDLAVFYERRVECVRYGCDGCLVYAGGQEFRADMVLCTVPLGVLKKGSIEFVPPLPERKREAIERLGFGLLNKVAMLFPYNFWGGDIDTFGHLSEDPKRRGEFFLFYSYSSVSGGPVLVALVAGEAAIEFEKESPVDSVERVLDILRGIFYPKGVDVPSPLQAVCTRWGQDQFAYGSYSHVAVGSSGDDYDILAESTGNGRVFFAGEATNRQYPATMHGAFLSGMREAANILKAAKKRSLETDNKTEYDNKSEHIEDLSRIFGEPDLKFGNFAVLFDPKSDDPESRSLLRVEFQGDRLESGPLHLYGLLTRNQAVELSKVDSDADRLTALNQKFGVRLVGRKGLCASANPLIAFLREKIIQREGS